MKELTRRTAVYSALCTTLTVGWIMETTGITSSKANEDSSERKLRQGMTVFSLISGVLYLIRHQRNR